MFWILTCATVMAAALFLCPASPAAAEAPPLAVAVSFNAAWNAHELDATVSHFVPDAVIRQRNTPLSESGSHAYALDTYGRGTTAVPDTLLRDGDTLTWATGEREIRRWIAEHFAAGHRADAAGFAADGEIVTWRYRASTLPLGRFPSVPPAEGTVEALVRGGKIASLTLEADFASISARNHAVDRLVLAASFRSASAGTVAPGVRPSRQDVQRAGLPSPLRVAVPAALGLGFAAVLAAFSRPAHAAKPS